MSSASKATWVVAASVAAVEALKDQGGICRWNYALRSLHQHAKRKISSQLSEANKRIMATNSSSSSIVGRRILNADELEKANRSEESLRTVMYLSSWGPN